MTLNEKLSRKRVAGFLHSEGGRVVNGRGEEILLCGMGLGNWLLPEGYMWKFRGRYNRPATIESLVRHLCGSGYAAHFWKVFRDRYVTEADVRHAIAEATRKKALDCSGAEYFTYHEGLCVQCMHLGPYDSEPETIAQMKQYLAAQGCTEDHAETRMHHEIYLSDPRRTAPEKLKTVIRIPAKRI